MDTCTLLVSRALFRLFFQVCFSYFYISAAGTPHLADVLPLVPLVDKLDGEGPVVAAGSVAHREPLVLGEGAGARAQDVPVPQPDPGHLRGDR